MIVTSEHAREALEILTGSRTPCIMDLDERTYEFYKGFLEPLLKNEGCVFGLVNALPDDADLNPHEGNVLDIIRANGGKLPTHTWPEGEPIMYKIEDDKGVTVLCAECVKESDKITHYVVGATKCYDCRNIPEALGERYGYA